MVRIVRTGTPRGFSYKPNDKDEPKIGDVVEVPEELAVVLLCRRWGELAPQKTRASKRADVETGD